MKTKLLKKVRKRYTISYYPHGFTNRWGDFEEGSHLVLRYTNRFGLIRKEDYGRVPELNCAQTDSLVQVYLTNIIGGLRSDYPDYRRKSKVKEQLKNQFIKVWYGS